MNNKSLENEFDINFYIEMNNDVAIRYNFDFNNIKDHFYKIGHKEKRLFSKSQSNLYHFNDWVKYIINNKDLLKVKINNEILAFRHYLEHGVHEKRVVYPKKINKYEVIHVPIESNFEVIDLDFTKKINNELTNLKENEIINFVSDNIKNERLLFSLNHRNLYENYDWTQYLIDYPDLKINKIFSKLDALYHYLSFGSKEGRNLKIIKDLDKKIDEKNNDMKDNNEEESEEKPENSCLNILNQIDKNDESLIDIFKNNILDNTSNLDIKKYNIKDKNQFNKIYEILCLEFDYKYYYLLNNDQYNIDNNEESCLEHFFNIGVEKYLPYSRNHYMLKINYDWNIKKSKNTKEENYLSYIKDKYYYNKYRELPNIKYSISEFIFEFYNTLYKKQHKNILLAYKEFLNNENENKIFPNLFNYFLHAVINLNQFKKDNKLNLSDEGLIRLIKDSNYDFKKYKVEFNNVINLNIPDREKLVNLEEFKSFYGKIINYIKNNKGIHNINEINKEFRKLFNKDLFEIPKDFKFNNYLPYINQENKNLFFNIVISYITKYESLNNTLLSIIYQNFTNYKIIILNKCNSDAIVEEVNEFKKNYNVNVEIIIISNDELKINFDNFNNKKLKTNKNNNNLSIKNNFKVFEINILIDSNYYFDNNNFLEKINKIYEKDVFCFNKILNEIYTKNSNKLNSLFISNTNLLMNNIHLFYNYFMIELKEKDRYNLTKNILVNKNNYVDHNFYNSDVELTTIIDNNYPIFVLYEDKENLKYVKDIINYNIIEISEKEQFDNFIIYINDNKVYDNVVIIFIDKVVDNFESVKYLGDDIDNSEDYNLINLYKKSKKKNIKKNSKTAPKLMTYEAFMCNHLCRVNYLNTK